MGKGCFLSSNSQHFDQSIHLLSLKSMVNPSNFDFVSKNLNCSLLALQTLILKKTRWKGLHYHQNDRELPVVNFSVFSLIPDEGNITSKSRIWSWIALKTQCIFDEHYWFFWKKNIELQVKRRKRSSNFRKSSFPEKDWTNSIEVFRQEVC